ncbi:hypothetical protein EIP91_005388 [Steccherinum ochraceum]|uniref:Uncharacterized protein n=1 Tax=Steccherinum ochraceum TaxID=92696 RepID=A0A4V2MVU5_9APHY|nr:hypothetical protein EIP91_005388 [Steccherinum ochraceum]
MGELAYGRANTIEMMGEGDPKEYVQSGQLATMAWESLGEVPSLFDLASYLPLVKSMSALQKLGENMIVSRADVTDAKSTNSANNGPSCSLLASCVLIFVLYLLLRDSESHARLQVELDQAFPEPDAPINLQTLNRLPFLGAVCEESFRLGTPFGGLPRIVPQGGHVLDGVFVPEGTIVGVPPWTTQTSPENVYPEPEAFRPQRWMPGGLGPDNKIVKQGILSFSYGPFACIGKSLAQQELRLVTTKLLLNYHLKLSPEFDNEKFIAGIDDMRATIFRYPLLITAERRSA